MSPDSVASDALAASQHEPPLDRAWPHIRQALQGLKFGEVSIAVQDGVVVQVERTERKRIHKRER